MAFEPGGYADKLSNRHEGRWDGGARIMLRAQNGERRILLAGDEARLTNSVGQVVEE